MRELSAQARERNRDTCKLTPKGQVRTFVAVFGRVQRLAISVFEVAPVPNADRIRST